MSDGSVPGGNDLERALLGQEPTFTAAEVAARAGLPESQLRRIWRTLGFPERGDDRAYNEDDLEAMSLLAQLVEDGLFDYDLVLNVVRGAGLSMARLADWEVGTLIQRIEDVFVDRVGPGSPSEATDWLFGAYGDSFDRLLLYTWRRHVAAAVARIDLMRAVDADPHTTHLTVGFADIVGFTALSNELTRDKIGDLVEIFETRCGDVIAANSGRLIKTMGDAVLFVNDDPLAAYATAEGIIHVVGRDKRMPDVRIGLATGSVVFRLGDVYGPPVNLAARLTQVARRNRMIVDQATADGLPADQIETRPLPARPMRGFGVMEPLTTRRL
ncbi:adenylate/guanylate cyclase domain-containing protein [Nocardioides humilatus]|uniref:Adenylate/guanylate cyclase domain-containing protein n=1 Tax=Nocardioides humilatus TaxID=2607660 RepID=A0A5B1LK88_9ACTN|nr:adenylate/guanylate cyclase domain-containing protein [Nocardioides humilatus]KAA1421102.1 adenylate/guanylate cyclase domain-containing protein [Nocardioides humilatus]